MNHKTGYSELLKDPRWQKIRLQVFERDEWSCTHCGNNESMLSVHHYRYIKGKKPWEYGLNDLTTLCEECHNCEYNDRPSIDQLLIDTLREAQFMASDVHDIACGVHNMIMPYIPEVMASIVSWAISDRDMMVFICEMYFEHLAEKRKRAGRLQ